MDFFSIIFFLILYYIRPHEWSFVAALKPVMVCMGVAILAMFRREQGFSFKNFFRTPHDWLIVGYFLWVVLSAPNPFEVFGSLYNVFVFYFVTVQALSSIDRLKRFLTWWTFLIVAIAAMAVASEFGLDLVGSYDLTHGIMKNRLSLNTSLFNNPNSLGHSVVPSLMLLYFVCFWKRPVFSKIAVIPLVMLVLYCIYLTVSKGSFLAAFASIVLVYSFGRPRIVQLTILFLAVTVGYGSLYMLPRMNELKKAKSDPAIEGRLLAWQFGQDIIRTKTTGIGYLHFVDEFTKRHRFAKASHSSYVQVGTETGYIGLFFYLGILYCSLRTLIVAKTTTTDEERVRRMIFTLICSYMISSWMVDMAFRATYFLMAAAAAAFHRHMLLKAEATDTELNATTVEVEPVSIALARVLPAAATPAMAAQAVSNVALNVPIGNAAMVQKKGSAATVVSKFGVVWNRFGIVDAIIVALMVKGVVEAWQYLMYHI